MSIVIAGTSFVKIFKGWFVIAPIHKSVAVAYIAAVALFVVSSTLKTVAAADARCKILAGIAVPIPTLPVFVILILSDHPPS